MIKDGQWNQFLQDMIQRQLPELANERELWQNRKGFTFIIHEHDHFYACGVNFEKSSIRFMESWNTDMNKDHGIKLQEIRNFITGYVRHFKPSIKSGEQFSYDFKYIQQSRNLCAFYASMFTIYFSQEVDIDFNDDEIKQVKINVWLWLLLRFVHDKKITFSQDSFSLSLPAIQPLPLTRDASEDNSENDYDQNGVAAYVQTPKDTTLTMLDFNQRTDKEVKMCSSNQRIVDFFRFNWNDTKCKDCDLNTIMKQFQTHLLLSATDSNEERYISECGNIKLKLIDMAVFFRESLLLDRDDFVTSETNFVDYVVSMWTTSKFSQVKETTGIVSSTFFNTKINLLQQKRNNGFKYTIALRHPVAQHPIIVGNLSVKADGLNPRDAFKVDYLSGTITLSCANPDEAQKYTDNMYAFVDKTKQKFCNPSNKEKFDIQVCNVQSSSNLFQTILRMIYLAEDREIDFNDGDVNNFKYDLFIRILNSNALLSTIQQDGTIVFTEVDNCKLDNKRKLDTASNSNLTMNSNDSQPSAKKIRVGQTTMIR
jgi:hypothetical protein